PLSPFPCGCTSAPSKEMAMSNAPAPHAAISLSLPEEQATEALAASFAPLLCGRVAGIPEGGRIHLRGDLGAGKTSFVRALLRAAGIRGRIKSPSYALLESYNLS